MKKSLKTIIAISVIIASTAIKINQPSIRMEGRAKTLPSSLEIVEEVRKVKEKKEESLNDQVSRFYDELADYWEWYAQEHPERRIKCDD